MQRRCSTAWTASARHLTAQLLIFLTRRRGWQCGLCLGPCSVGPTCTPPTRSEHGPGEAGVFGRSCRLRRISRLSSQPHHKRYLISIDRRRAASATRPQIPPAPVDGGPRSKEGDPPAPPGRAAGGGRLAMGPAVGAICSRGGAGAQPPGLRSLARPLARRRDGASRPARTGSARRGSRARPRRDGRLVAWLSRDRLRRDHAA